MYRRTEVGQVARALRVLDELRGFKRGRWISEIAKEVGASCYEARLMMGGATG